MTSLNVKPKLILVSMIFLMVPFSYLEVIGVRIIALAAVFSVLLFFVSFKSKFYLDNNLILFLGPFVLVLSYSLISGSKDFISILIFGSYLAVFNFLTTCKIKKIFSKCLTIYLFGALFISVGVMVQRLLFELVGYEIGKIDYYGGGRIGFGFIWTDYSFLSLYLLTALPFVYCLYNNLLARFLLSIVLLLGSVLTTARTGLAALLITSFCFVLIESLKILATGKVNRRGFFMLSALVFLSFVCIYLYVQFSTREVRFDGSDRLEGYYLAIKSFIDHPFFGVMFNREYFASNYGVIPHNLFIYILSQGGALLLFFFVPWFLYVLYVAAFKVKLLKYPIIIASFGFMFIPSFFSAYFFASLVSLAMAENRVFVKEGC